MSKGRYMGKKKELKHFLNYEEDQLAGAFQRDQHPQKGFKEAAISSCIQNSPYL